MRLVTIMVWICLCTASCPEHLQAQVHRGPAVTLRTGTGLRPVTQFDNDTCYLRVWDKKGKPISNLDSSDIDVTIDAEPADIISFAKDSSLISNDLAVSLVLDNSTSMFHAYDSLSKYIDSFVDSLGAGVVFSATVFDNTERRPTYESSSRQNIFIASEPFMSDRQRLRSYVHFFDTIRSDFTPLFDAIWASLEHIRERRRNGDSLRNDVMLVITDGDDNCSLTSVEDVEALALAMGVKIYLLNYRSEPSERMFWLLTRSKGISFMADDLPGLREELRNIRMDLSIGYKIVFGITPGGPRIPIH